MSKKCTREVITKRENKQYTSIKFIKGLSFLLVVAILGSNIAPSIVIAKTTEDTTFEFQEESMPDDINTQGDLNIDADTLKKFGEKIDYLKMSKKATISTENKAMLVDMTASELLGGSFLSSRSNFSGFNDLMFILTTLREAPLTDIVTVSKRAASLKGENIFGFKEGDKISLNDLLLCFYFTGSEDARLAIVDHIAGNDTTFIAMMNSVARNIGLINTNYSNINGDYNKSQRTMLYDIYSIVYELFNEDFMKEVLTENKLFITYENSNGNTVKKACVNQSMIDANSVAVPENMKIVIAFTRNCKILGNGQIVLVEGEDGHFYLSILMEVDKRRDIGKESGRILEIVNGKEYFDEKIPTPTPTPTKKPEPTPKPTVTPKPTPKPTAIPTPTPIAYKAKIPTQSNNARYQFLMNTNYKAYTIYDAPVGFRSATEAAKNMKVITVPVWKMDVAGKKYPSTMKLSIHKKLADGVSSIFKEIYDLPMKFPVKTMLGFSYRKVGGVGLSQSTLLSIHSFGAAIDINPGDYDNDYFLGKGNDLRNRSNPYCIPDEVIEIFASYGWFWGGDFEISADTMHFQYLGLEFLSYQGKNPFRELKYKDGTVMSGIDVKNLQQRLNRLGYKVTVDGTYGKNTETVIKKFQKDNKLKETGVVNYSTWEKLINLTHYMGYVF
ncbi:peptidoglycan-binding protein [Lachnoclostridium phytofermentans]|uniref:Peptidoglycan-binding domain 1 protein n=1 Tax=Lachnoclostridium phytofermentans (strain ATCC 700394 / DSM 18823 / ISDg) TaxID=357809 RepID=A9KN76_LACP7|nr:peptidoglycan-binding protein [Lachnoclostridium phytofermentans]ABX41575.1 Peptidoglycan-binding domain 1 protein [Lachnoclostridium phytofermentans ISDg]